MWFRKLRNDEGGSVLVLAALAIVVLLGFTALAVDGGYLYHRNTRLQDIADACALAGAMQIGETTGSDTDKKDAAMLKAVDYAEKNGIDVIGTTGYTRNVKYSNGDNGTMTVTFPNGVKDVKVAFSIDTKLFFARVLGFDQTPVASSGKARLGTAKSASGEGLVPIALIWDKNKQDDDPYNDDYVIGNTYELAEYPGKGTRGNYNYLDFKKLPGGSDKEKGSQFEWDLKWGFGGTLSEGQVVPTNPGITAGQVDGAINGIDGRIAQGRTEILVPIFDAQEFSGVHGKSDLTIIGFAKLQIISYDKHTKSLKAKFIKEVANAPINDGEETEFFMKSVQLVE